MKMKIGAMVAGFVVVMALFFATTLAGGKEVMGVIVRSGDASIEVEAQSVQNGTVKVAKVVAPADSWVVIHLAGEGEEEAMPGEVVGYAPVKAGTTTDVEVKLSDTSKVGSKLIAAVYIDRGEIGKFEFNPKDLERSADKPYVADGMEVAMPVEIR